VELKPTLQQLFDTVHGTCKSTVSSLEALPRLLPEVLAGCAAAGPLPACLRWVPGQLIPSICCPRISAAPGFLLTLCKGTEH